MKNKKAAMEMSVGTIVTIVLLMSVMVLGLVLIRGIFSSGTNAIDQIDGKVRSAIDNLFLDDSDLKMALYPSDAQVSIEQRSQGEGFAFSLRNVYFEEKDFRYEVGVDEQFDIDEQCRITPSQANGWLLVRTSSITLPGSGKMERPELVLLNVPENAPTCTIPYVVTVTEIGSSDVYTTGKVYVTIVPR